MEWNRMRCSRWMVLVAAVALAFGCSDPEETDKDNQNQPDNGDVGVDAADVEDAGGDTGDVDIDDTGVDADDADVDDVDVADVDDVGEDADVDDGPVDGQGDNCPEISNPDQRDRSRDGIGDACDNFPYFHDPSNPESLDVIYEEDGGPNDDFWDANIEWMLDLPLRLEGAISEPGDIDFYSFSVDEPTTLLIHVEQLTSTSDLWPVMLVWEGMFESFLARSVVYADNQGESVVQDLHLPVAGEYHFVISDYHNLVEGGGGTGGDDYGYRISISEPPLPEPTPVATPVPRQIEPYDDRVASTYTVDVTEGDTLRVEATGAPRNQLSLLFPSIQFLDPDTGDVLAYTFEDNVEAEAMRNELTMKVGDLDEVLVVVESHAAIGDNDVVIDFEVFDKPDHLEPPEAPRHTRGDYLVWMNPTSWISSMIGPPIPEADDALAPDEDYFMMMTNPGDFFRVVAEPVEEGLLDPELTFGRFNYVNGDYSYFTWYDEVGADTVGDTTEISALITRDDQPESVLHVSHAGNAASPLPVGGPDYAYDLHVERLDWEQQAEPYEEFPVSIPVVLESGEQGLYDVDFEPGYEYEIEYSGSWWHQLQIVDTDTWEVVDSSSGATISHLARPDQQVVLAVRDEDGEPITDFDDVSIDISEEQSPQTVDAPDVIDGTLDDDTSSEVFLTSMSDGELLEVRTASSTGPAPEIELIGDDVDTMTSEEATTVAAEAGADTEVMIVVERATSANVEYSMSVQSVVPEAVDAPFETHATFDDELHGSWWSAEVDDNDYVVNLNGTSELDNPHWMAVVDAQTLELIVENDEGFAVFDGADVDSGEVYVVAADVDGPLDESTEFAISVAAVDAQTGDDSMTVEIIDGVRPAFVELEHEQAGLSMVEVDSGGGDDEPLHSVIIDMENHDIVATQLSSQPLTAVAKSSSRDLAAAVFAGTTDDQTLEADVDVDYRWADQAMMLDFDEATQSDPKIVDDWPAIYRGELNPAIDYYRGFASEMEADTRLWALTMPGDDTEPDDVDPQLYLVDPDGSDHRHDLDGGEGNFPALQGVDLDEEGQWTVELGSGDPEDLIDGEFVIYLLRR